MGNAKMAGSVGNVVNVVDLLGKVSPGNGAIFTPEYSLPQSH